MKYLLLFFLAAISNSLWAQDVPPRALKQKDSLKKKRLTNLKNKIAANAISIKDYKIISFERDTTYLDTTLTINKEFKYNILRRDDFELMPFSNIGQPYNTLGVSFDRKNMYPKLGAKAKHFNYTEMEEVAYYNVATPLTDILFKTTFEQGQLLDALLTFNTSKRMNFSVAYTGMRSLGKYQFNQSELRNFKTTANYETKDGRYSMRAHIAAQDIESEENGGLLDKETQFESKDPDFRDRVKADVRFSTALANNQVLGKRYFIDHKYKLIKKQQDSSSMEKTSLAIAHRFNYETKFNQFSQSQQNDFFGGSFLPEINDRARLKTMLNQVSADFYNATLGNLQAHISLYNYNYFFNSVLVTENQRIVNQLKGEEVALGANYQKQIKEFFIKASAQYKLTGDLTGNIFNASASYQFNENNKIRFGIHSSARMPDFNFLLYQSDYVNYNWQNTSSFKNERVNSIYGFLDSKTWGMLSAKVTNVDNYAYFAADPNEIAIENQENAFIRPFQETSSLQHIKVKYSKEIKVGAFALNNTVMYQNVNQSNQVLNVPQLVTRNTLYFSSDVFKKAMFLQMGVTLKYFTGYNANAYNPVLGEFYIQNGEKIGGFPLLDFFINAKVQQTRIFLKAEHFNSSFGSSNFYAAPDYPYRDFVIRFGLVWNFFS